MMRALLVTLAAVVLLTARTFAQSPMPVIVPAATATTPVRAAIAVEPTAGASALKQLLEMKAANEEIIRKQSATLEQLDELQKNAEQLRIYSKRS
jgi:hypothetical protein